MALLLSSPHFRDGRRYTAVLEFIVRETLAGNSDSLEERTLGIVVFKRPPDYDTSADPVVRVTAGEVRQRLALFYQEREHVGELRIDLPPGSYVPEFLPAHRYPHHATPSAQAEPLEFAATSAEVESPTSVATAPKRFRLRGPDKKWIRALGLAAVAVVLIFVSIWMWNSSRDEFSHFWKPLLTAKMPVLLLVGQPAVAQADSSPADSESHHQRTATSEIFLQDGVALSHICSVLGNHTYHVSGARQATVSDAMKRPVILVGAFDNPWTVQALKPLRFSLAKAEGEDSATSSPVFEIVDRKRQAGSPWAVDANQPDNKLAHDYAIVAQFHEDASEGIVTVVAGIGPTGTESAGEFVSSSADMHALAKWAPFEWSGKNMEAVIDTEIIDGQPSRPRVIAAEFW